MTPGHLRRSTRTFLHSHRKWWEKEKFLFELELLLCDSVLDNVGENLSVAVINSLKAGYDLPLKISGN